MERNKPKLAIDVDERVDYQRELTCALEVESGNRIEHDEFWLVVAREDIPNQGIGIEIANEAGAFAGNPEHVLELENGLRVLQCSARLAEPRRGD